ncbi:MAG: hypothetical protein LBL07_04720 [Tannerella sp.]|jgi:hypothetical protein|nr:hypothetical protein [Tannerella sp.]
MEAKNILELESVDKNPNSLATDFKAEVIVANLVEQGFDSSKIILIRDSAARRGFAKDVEDISLHFSAGDLADYLYIRTNRESIYDILPEGIFHQPVNKRLNKDKEDILDEMKIHRREEFFARKFFQLFEIETDRFLSDIYLHELRYDKKLTHSSFIGLFSHYWPVLKLLESEQAVFFIHTIPIINRIRTSRPDVEEALSLILGVPVHLKNIKLARKETIGSIESRLDDHRIGIDFILGNTFDDGLYDMKITIGPISALKMQFFLKNALGDQILERLCQLFLPSNVFTVKEYILMPEDSHFILSDNEKSTYMGINTFI